MEITFTVAENTYTRYVEHVKTVPSESGKGMEKIYNVYEVRINPMSGDDVSEPELLALEISGFDLRDFFLAPRD